MAHKPVRLGPSRSSGLHRAALALSLVPAPAMVLAFLIIACHSLAHGDPHYFGYNYFLVVLGWVALFLLLAACSRKTPLYGGLLSVVLSACLIVWVSRAWWLVLLYAIVMFSGLLYLIAWLEGRRAGRP